MPPAASPASASAAAPVDPAGTAEGDALAKQTFAQRVRTASTSSGARSGGLAMVDQALVSATNFLPYLLIGKFGGEAALGVYALCFSIVFFVSELQQRMLATPYMVFLHRKRDASRAAYLGSTLVHFAISSAVAAIGIAAYSIYLSWSYGDSSTALNTWRAAVVSSTAVPITGVFPLAANGMMGYSACLSWWQSAATMTIGMWLLVIVGPVFMLREFLRNVAFAHLQMRSAVAGDAIVFVVQATGLALLAWWGRLTIPAAFVVIGIATGLSSLSWAIARPLPVRYRRQGLALHWRQNWAYSQWLVLGRMAGSFSRLAMPWIVLWAADKIVVSHWAACLGLVGGSWIFIRGVTNYLRPLTISAYAKDGPAAMVRVVWLGIGLFLVILGSIAAVLWAYGDWLLSVVYRPEYAVAAAAVAVLGVNAVVTAVGMTVSNALSAMCDTKSQFWGELVTLVFTLGCAWPLVSRYGATGAAWSLLIGSSASLIYMAAMLARDLRREPAVASA